MLLLEGLCFKRLSFEVPVDLRLISVIVCHGRMNLRIRLPISVTVAID